MANDMTATDKQIVSMIEQIIEAGHKRGVEKLTSTFQIMASARVVLDVAVTITYARGSVENTS